MIVADAVHTDPITGKRYILGSFAGISSPEFPLTYPTLAVYVALTDGRGLMPFRLVLLDLDLDAEPLFDVEGEVEFSGPRAEVDLFVTVPNVIFSSPGEYAVQIFVAGQFVAERRIIMTQEPKQ